GGIGSRHVEVDGTHLLLPKVTTPNIDINDATGADRATLHNPDLIRKDVWSYENTEYVIYCRPGTQIVHGNHEERKAAIPIDYIMIEADRRRQTDAPVISNSRFQQALRGKI